MIQKVVVEIHDAHIVSRIHRLAELIGAEAQDAVADAVSHRLAGLEPKPEDAARATRRVAMAAALAELDATPKFGAPLTDDDLYGPDGLPLSLSSTHRLCSQSTSGNLIDNDVSTPRNAPVRL